MALFGALRLSASGALGLWGSKALRFDGDRCRSARCDAECNWKKNFHGSLVRAAGSILLSLAVKIRYLLRVWD